MPQIKAETCAISQVAATAWLNHLGRCRVRRCRRAGRCLGVVDAFGSIQCIRPMRHREMMEMLDFVDDARPLLDPEVVEARLEKAVTAEDREMILYRRDIALLCCAMLEQEEQNLAPLSP